MSGDGRGKLTTIGPFKRFNMQLAEKICELAAKGMYKKHIAAACGISQSTLKDWLNPYKRKGEDYDRFREMFAEAEAKDVQTRIDRISAAAIEDSKNWKADAWILERRYPLDFGERKHISHTAPQAGLTQDQFAKLTPAQQEKYLKALEAMEQVLMLGAGDED